MLGGGFGGGPGIKQLFEFAGAFAPPAVPAAGVALLVG